LNPTGEARPLLDGALTEVHVNSKPSPAAAPAASPAIEREVRLTTLLVTGALLLGAVLQILVPPGPLTLVAASGLAGLVVFGASVANPGRLRETIAGFRFTSTLLIALAVMAMLGTLVLQGKPAELYRDRYGAAGALILALRLDDIFHGLPFAGLMALFGAAVVASAGLRWPTKGRNIGFFICHLGLILSLAGAAASAALSIRGRIDLHAGGETATHVRVTKAGLPTGEHAPLGFDLKLDQFRLVPYETEFRVGYYEEVPVEDEHGTHLQWKLQASFDPDLAKHRLPSGDSFQLTGIWPSQDAPKVVQVQLHAGGTSQEKLLRHEQPEAIFIDAKRALVFEKRDKEVKAYLSTVSAFQGGRTLTSCRTVSVNEPIDVAGWTLYQVNYDPADPSYSGLEAVHDPGVAWVFLGFALISLGVFWMFYVEPRLKGRKARPAAGEPSAEAA
jgi:hypothetical protein